MPSWLSLSPACPSLFGSPTSNHMGLTVPLWTTLSPLKLPRVRSPQLSLLRVRRYGARHCAWTRLHRALLCCLRCVFCLRAACYVFTNAPLVVHPFTCTSYHIHNDVINHLNNVILLARENLRQVPCHVSDIDFDQRRKTRIPRDYQGTSACTLEAAAVQCPLAELPCGPLLMKDILLRKMHSGVRATVFTHDAVQLLENA